MASDAILLNVKVTPNSAKNEVLGLTNGVWRVKIAAPPDKGKANKETLGRSIPPKAVKKARRASF